MFNLFEKKHDNEKFRVFRNLDFKYLYAGKCRSCESRINRSSLFSNSLVALDSHIFTQCLKCRSYKKYNLDTENEDENFNRTYGLIFDEDNTEKVEKMIKYINHVYPSWIDLLLSLRLGIILTDYAKGYFYLEGFTQSERPISTTEYYNFLHTMLENRKRDNDNFYGNLFSIRKCGECGHDWPSKNSKEAQEIARKGMCPKCNLPNKFQWHMRESFESELNNLYKESYPI